MLSFSSDINYHRSLTGIALKSYFNNRSDSNWEVYRRLRNLTRSKIRRLKMRNSSRFFRTSSTREMWNRLGRVGVLSGSNASAEVNVDDVNRNFIGNQLVVEDSIPEFAEFNTIGFSFTNVSIADLHIALLRIRSNSVGSDGVSIRLLKIVFPYLSGHMLHIINSILMSSRYPCAWKVSRIIPIPKKKGDFSIDNMRPISIMPVLSKVVENIMKEQMMQWVKDNGMLSECQFGFCRGRNTGLLLTELIESVKKN